MTTPTPSQVMSQTPTTSRRLTSSPTQSPWPHRSFSKQRFPEDVEYDDTWSTPSTCPITPSEKALSVGQSVVCVRKHGATCRRANGGDLFESIGPGAKCCKCTDQKLCWTVRKSEFSTNVQAEIKKHEFQANYDRRSVRKFGQMIESQQEKLHCAQELIISPQWNWRIKEVSEFHLRHHCKTKISRGSGHYFGTYWQDAGFAKWN